MVPYAAKAYERLLPPALLEVQPNGGVDNDALDVLIELIRSFGPMLQDVEKKALQKSTVAILNHERTSSVAKKKAVSAVSFLALYVSDALLSIFVSNTLESLSKPNLTAPQYRVLIMMIGSLARTVPQRFGRFVKTLIPFALRVLSEEEYRKAMEETAENGGVDIEGDEVREAALLAIEACLLCCSNDMRPSTDESIQAALRYLAYDPNLAGSGDDEMDASQNSDFEETQSDAEEEDFEEEGAMSDDEDVSWKLRRCAAKVLYAIISTRSSGDLLDNGVLYHKIAPVLVTRFQEREENVRLEVLGAMTALIRKTSVEPRTRFTFAGETELEMPSAVEARSRKRRRLGSDATLFESPINTVTIAGFTSPEISPPPTSGPRADLARLSGRIIQSLAKLLRESTPATKQSGIALLRELVIVQRGGLTQHFQVVAGPLVDAIKSVPSGSHLRSVGSAASATDGKIRIEALQLLCAVCDHHSSTIVAPHASDIVPAVVAAVKDNYVKLSSEAIIAVEGLLKVLTPPRSASADRVNATFVEQLYTVILDRTVAIDADVGVRQRAIHALGVLLARGSGMNKGITLSDAQRKKSTEALLDRLKNETTRLSAVRAIDMFLTSSQDMNNLPKGWMQDVAMELGAQLRKADRVLRGASLAALRDMAGNSIALSCLDTKTLKALASLLLPLVDSNDLNLLGMALVILAKLVRHSPGQLADQNLDSAVVEIIKTPLAGGTLDALLLLLKAIGEKGIGKSLMQNLLAVGVNGDPTVVGKAIGTLLVAGASTVGVKLDDFVRELQNVEDEQRKCLALSVLGEAGQRLGTSSPLQPALFTAQFGVKSQSLPRAAATALGRAGAGNIEAYMPVILSSTSRSGSSQYLSLHAIKEILQSSSQSKADMSPHAKPMWDKLLAASQAEDNKAVGAECIGRLAVIDPKTFLPSLKVRNGLL